MTPAAQAGRAPLRGGELLTPPEVADLLRISEKTLRNWRASTPPRGPAYVKAGALVRYRRGDVEKFLTA